MKGKTTVKYLLVALLSLSLTALYILLRPFPAGDRKHILQLLCDGFTVPGFVMVLLGLLLWLTGKGALDGLGYVVGNAVRTLIPGLAARKEQSYYDYTRRQRKHPVFGAFLITGGVDLLIAVGLLAAYLRL